MPEYPDVTIYLEALQERIGGATYEGVRLASPFLLRSVNPRPADVAGRKVTGFRRIGKRICIGLEDDAWIVIHLMVAGRFKWDDKPKVKVPGRVGLAGFDFSTGTLILTEASKKKRARLHFCGSTEALEELNPGGKEIFELDRDTFAEMLTAENHTLKRSLTDQRVFSGIGNAYSDEILHRAKLSPVKLSQKLKDDEITRLFEATQTVLEEWTERFRGELKKKGFPKKVTAFRKEMAVHGKYKEPCPVCGDPVQRIRYASNETNYCATCQNGGKLLADRALSRLLKKDWPKTLEELEEYKAARKV